jgi:hypothetical protein
MMKRKSRRSETSMALMMTKKQEVEKNSVAGVASGGR